MYFYKIVIEIGLEIFSVVRLNKNMQLKSIKLKIFQLMFILQKSDADISLEMRSYMKYIYWINIQYVTFFYEFGIHQFILCMVLYDIPTNISSRLPQMSQMESRGYQTIPFHNL